jgi:hypothetical protein
MELDSREGTVVMWEESLMFFAPALGEAHAGRDASRTHACAIRRDYLTQVSTSSSMSEWHKTLCQTLDECATLLGLQEMDLGVHKEILVEELERSLLHPDGRDLPMELDETHAWVHGIANDRANEARRLSR